MVDIKEVAKKVIADEALAIQNLARFIDDDFEKVVRLIYNTKGRVIVTGIGKSAIIAQKIVATLNSTGTPAVFMHAADAIHGDLGMICHDDVVICISKSGNTPEIKVLVPLIRMTVTEQIRGYGTEYRLFSGKECGLCIESCRSTVKLARIIWRRPTRRQRNL